MRLDGSLCVEGRAPDKPVRHFGFFGREASPSGRAAAQVYSEQACRRGSALLCASVLGY